VSDPQGLAFDPVAADYDLGRPAWPRELLEGIEGKDVRTALEEPWSRLPPPGGPKCARGTGRRAVPAAADGARLQCEVHVIHDPSAHEPNGLPERPTSLHLGDLMPRDLLLGGAVW